MKNPAAAEQIPALTVVIPVHNESENIFPLISEIRNALDPIIDYEIIYIDDGSEDDTYIRLQEIADGFSRLRIMRHRICCGQSAAIWSGVQAAQSEWIATLDGDCQNDPSDIPRLIQILENTSDSRPPVRMICGYRRKRLDSRVKKLSSRVANSIRSYLLKDDTPDTGCGLKLFERRPFLELPYFDHMHRFLPSLIMRNEGITLSVEVNHRPRQRGRSHYGIGNRLWVGITDLFGVMWLQRRPNRSIRNLEEIR